MADHDYVTTSNWGRFRAICRCGWQSPWSDSEDAVEALADAHRELADPIPPNFSDDGAGDG